MHQKVSKKYINWLTCQIIGCAIEVHRALGAGLLEKVYEKALCRELELRGFEYKQQCSVEVDYKACILSLKLRYDVLVERLIVIEAKAVLQMAPVIDSQLLTYMYHLKVPKGILINFNAVNLYRDGTKTMVNKLFQELPEE